MFNGGMGWVSFWLRSSMCLTSGLSRYSVHSGFFEPGVRETQKARYDIYRVPRENCYGVYD